MEKRAIGHSGLTCAPIALGTWAIGGGEWWGTTDDTESIKAIHCALDQGITLIDTAPAYGFGHSECVVGEALKGRRDQAVIATKCGLWFADQRGTPFVSQNGRMMYSTLAPETIRIEVENSLRNLQTDHIDLLQTHLPDLGKVTPIAETMACLQALKQEGKIRAIGVSNVTPAQMDEYRAAGILDTNQPRYSMLDRAIESEVMPYCMQHHISILAYSPLEQGLLTGKITMETQFAEREYRNYIAWIYPDNRRKVLDMLAGWRDLCHDLNCTVGQLVIAWTIAQPGITFALCGARKEKNVIENAGAAELSLSSEILARMRRDVEALGAPIPVPAYHG